MSFISPRFLTRVAVGILLAVSSTALADDPAVPSVPTDMSDSSQSGEVAKDVGSKKNGKVYGAVRKEVVSKLQKVGLMKAAYEVEAKGFLGHGLSGKELARVALGEFAESADNAPSAVEKEMISRASSHFIGRIEKKNAWFNVQDLQQLDKTVTATADISNKVYTVLVDPRLSDSARYRAWGKLSKELPQSWPQGPGHPGSGTGQWGGGHGRPDASSGEEGGMQAAVQPREGGSWGAVILDRTAKISVVAGMQDVLGEKGIPYPPKPPLIDPSHPLPPSPPIGEIIGGLPQPESPWEYEVVAKDKVSTGDGSGAISDLTDSIAHGGGAAALAQRGGIYLQQGDYARAYQDAQAALQIEPSNKAAMAVAQFSAGRGAGAASSSEHALMGGAERGASFGHSPRAALLSGAPASPSAVRFARDGENALRLGDLAGAKAYADKGLAASPDDAYLRALRAKIFMSQREYGKSLDDINAALARDPSNLTLLRAKAFAQNRAKKWRDAASTAGHILEIDPNDAYGYAYRAHAMAGMGERDAMMSDIARAARLDPRFADAARQAGALQLPSNGDIMFLFPGESGPSAAQAPAPEGRSRRFGALVAISALGGLLLAFGLLQTVLAPLKEQVSSVFTKITRTGPSTRSFTPPLEASSASASSGILPGLLRGQYEVSRQIGAGGMGMVYEGTDRSLGRRVAIKKMRDEIRADARERARFVTEAKTVAALHHPSIVDIYAIAEDGDDVFLVFEYVDGKTVHELVQTKGGLDPHAAGRIVSEVASALSFAHSRGVIHRDMKPSNIMVDGHGRVKVMDFGIARAAKDAMTRYSVTNTVVGTPPYMAPEQEQGQVRRESDVYALGVCAYEMLTGKLPFTGTGGGMMLNKINMSYVPPSRQKEGLPASLDAVFERAFQADPDKRFRTPAEFSEALAASVPAAARA